MSASKQHVSIKEPDESNSSDVSTSYRSSSSSSSKSTSAGPEEGSLEYPIVEDILTQEFFEEFFAEFDDDEFVEATRNVIQEFEHLSNENDIFTKFLLDNEPILLINLEEIKRIVKKLQVETPLLPHYFNMPEIITTESMPFVLGPALNVSTRSDLVSRFIDELKLDTERFENDVLRQTHRLNAQIEESEIRLEESTDALAAFEETIVIGAVNPITQRIPAEKLVQYINAWMKSARFTADRIRLNTSCLKGEFARMQQLYEQKLELGVTLTDTDFENLRIQNTSLAQQIEQGGVHLIELKQFCGTAFLELTTARKMLQDLENMRQKLLHAIDAKERDRLAFAKEMADTIKMMPIVESSYKHVKKLVEHCRAPETLEYLRVKHRQNELMKEYKILCRKEYLMGVIMKSKEMLLMKLTHRKTVNPLWYEPLMTTAEDELDAMYDMAGVPILSEFDIYKVINEPPTASK